MAAVPEGLHFAFNCHPCDPKSHSHLLLIPFWNIASACQSMVIPTNTNTALSKKIHLVAVKELRTDVRCDPPTVTLPGLLHQLLRYTHILPALVTKKCCFGSATPELTSHCLNFLLLRRWGFCHLLLMGKAKQKSRFCTSDQKTHAEASSSVHHAEGQV